MKPRRVSWEHLAASGFATAVAAATTIGHRTTMLATVRDVTELGHPEFIRMGSEKIEAAAAAGVEMALAAPMLSLRFVEWTWSAGQHAQAALAEVAFCRSPGELVALQRRWVGRMTDANQRLAETVLGVAAAGLRPVHHAAAANARRLGRQSRRT
jgi:hypothetical protein